MNIDDLPQTIINLAKYFHLIFLMTMWLCQLMGPAWTSLVWHRELFIESLDTFCAFLPYHFVCDSSGKMGSCHVSFFRNFCSRSSGIISLFAFQSLDAGRSSVVGMRNSNFDVIELKRGEKICALLYFLSWFFNVFSNEVLLSFLQSAW